VEEARKFHAKAIISKAASKISGYTVKGGGGDNRPTPPEPALLVTVTATCVGLFAGTSDFGATEHVVSLGGAPF
jgi:hypothetical protein